MGGRSQRWDPGVRDRVGVGGLTPLSEPMDKEDTSGGLAGYVLRTRVSVGGRHAHRRDGMGQGKGMGGALARGQGSRLPLCLVAGL